MKKSKLTLWLEQTNGFWFCVYAMVSVFCLYTCIYSFRKSFSAATFQGMEYLNISYKSWLVIFQVVGYALSKFIGIKIISELKSTSRAIGILLMSGIAIMSWFLFALVPPPYNIIFLFTNGFPLGMVWGMVLGYLEGRRFTEVLGAGLSVSFIFSAGICKSVGAFIMRDWHVSELWMPFVSSMLFILPALFFLFLVNQVPPPTTLDEQLRTRRQPMNIDERKKFIATFLPGIILFVSAYMLMTGFRDLRDNYSAEVWKILGYGNSTAIFTATEVPISLIILVAIGSLMLIKNNHIALMVIHVIIIFGMVLLGVSTFLFEQHIISAPLWMVLIGLGLYLGYIPFNSIFFDRMLAAFHYFGTIGFIMYVADSFGYLGSVSVLFFKEFGYAQVSWVNFFISCGYLISVLGTLLMTGSMIYFYRKYQTSSTKHQMTVQDLNRLS